MRPVTGFHPDFAIVGTLGGRMLITVGALACAVLVYRLGWLAVVARSRTPTRDLARGLAALFGQRGLAANAAHTLALFLLFGSGFAVLKGAIAVIAPFGWDSALAEFDRALHFGRAPYEWLLPLLDRPWIVFGINIAYNLWFFVVMAGFIAAGFATRRQALRHQYLMSFMLVWFVGGFLVALGVSSAGPAYYQRIGLGELYAPLMAQLHAAAERFPIWALDTQDALWAGFSGARPGSAGISAFPSMHVATTTLFVLAARRIGPRLYALALGFWAIIMTGSVLLGWHYAADGYAGALISLLAWQVAGLYGRRVRPVEPAPVELEA